MRFIITGRNIDISRNMEQKIYEKLGKLEKYFSEETEAHVTLSVEKERRKIEVTIPVKGSTIRCEEESDDMYASIDLAQETIERQLKKYKGKLLNYYQSGASFNDTYAASEEDTSDELIKIVRTKRFAIKPMDAEEACLQMELLGHSFYVFLNSETDEVNVVYKRKGANTYGLIEPIFD